VSSITPIVLSLVAVNVVVSLLGFLARGRGRDAFVFVPYRVARGDGVLGMVLSHFAHADVSHLFVNMLALVSFGPILEVYLGPAALLVVYVAAGVLATATTFVLRRHDPRFRSLGASGSTAGVLFAAIVLRPQMQLSLFFLPILVPAPVFAVLYVLLSSYFMGRTGSRICHEAHVGGAVAGLVLGGLLSPHGFAPLVERIQRLLA
jgi:membrane associated rhomboid family serine protease